MYPISDTFPISDNQRVSDNITLLNAFVKKDSISLFQGCPLESLAFIYSLKWGATGPSGCFMRCFALCGRQSTTPRRMEGPWYARKKLQLWVDTAFINRHYLNFQYCWYSCCCFLGLEIRQKNRSKLNTYFTQIKVKSIVTWLHKRREKHAHKLIYRVAECPRFMALCHFPVHTWFLRLFVVVHLLHSYYYIS